MLRYWHLLANLGISPHMDPTKRKTVGLINRVSIISLIIFTLIALIPSLFTQRMMSVLLAIINISAFGSFLYLNSRQKYQLVKHGITLYGLVMVTLVNLLFDPASFPQTNYISLVILTVMIFQDKRVIYLYQALFILNFILVVFYFQAHFPPLGNMIQGDLQTGAALNIFINVFIIGFALIMFFKGIEGEYQTLLEQNNESLAKQHEELKHTHEQLKSAQSQLVQAEKMASLGQLTAGIAHEINNPINFVSGNISPLNRDLEELKELVKKIRDLTQPGQDSTQAWKEIQALIMESESDELFTELDALMAGITEGATRTKKIVAGLRVFSRLDEDLFKEADIHLGLDATLTLLTNRSKRSVIVHKDYGELPAISCLPGQLNQVFMNILVNALDAMEDEGEIFIRTTYESEQAIIRIRDTGPGMPQEVKEKIFEPFYTTKAVGKGTGLGLSISYGVIQKHQGSLSVESSPGEGTTFTITLPGHRKDDKQG